MNLETFELCIIEENLLHVFNKLSDVHFINSIVNISNYTLTNSKLVSSQKGWVFAPLQGPQTLEILSMMWMFSKEKLNLFFSRSNQDPPERNTQSGIPFEHKSFKLKSAFNPVGPFQLETMFHSIEQDLHMQKYREPRKKNLTKEGYKAIKFLRTNADINIKPADKSIVIVILDKQSYINEGERQLHNNQFYEGTD